jgi:hypothetical protein
VGRKGGKGTRDNEIGTRATLSERAIDHVCMHRNNMGRGKSGERDRVNEFGTRATLSQRAIDNVCMHRNNMERGGKNSPKKKQDR